MSQFLVGVPITLELTVYVNGAVSNLDATPSVVVVDGDGGTVTTGAVVAAGTGVYEVPMSGQTAPNVLRATWTGALSGDTFTRTTTHEVVGGFLFSEAEFRAFNDDQFASTTRFPSDAVTAARAAVTDQLEHWTGVSWVPRYCRVQAPGSGGPTLPLASGWARTSTGDQLPRPGRLQTVNRLLSVTVGGVSGSVSDVTVWGSHLTRPSGWPAASHLNPLNVTIEYVYGQQSPVDSVDRIAMLLAADRLRETVLSNRATTWSDELGTYRFETPGRAGNVSTLPEVNEWVKAHRSPLMSV